MEKFKLSERAQYTTIARYNIKMLFKMEIFIFQSGKVCLSKQISKRRQNDLSNLLTKFLDKSEIEAKSRTVAHSFVI